MESSFGASQCSHRARQHSSHAYQKIFSNLINKQKLICAATLAMEISFFSSFLGGSVRAGGGPEALPRGSAAVITTGGGLVSSETLGLVNNVPCYYTVRRCPASPAGPSGGHALPSLTVVCGRGCLPQGHEKCSPQTSPESSENDAGRLRSSAARRRGCGGQNKDGNGPTRWHGSKDAGIIH